MQAHSDSKTTDSGVRLPYEVADVDFWRVDSRYVTLRQITANPDIKIDFDKMIYEEAKSVTMGIYMRSDNFWKENEQYNPRQLLIEINDDTPLGRKHVTSRLQLAKLYYDLVKDGRYNW